MDKIELIHTVMMLGADTYNKTHTDRYEAQLKSEKLLDDYMQQVKNLNIPAAVDVKYLGVPNICFSLTDKDDKREIDFIRQRIKRGFDDSETWSLRDSIALFILPRLKRYQEIANDFLKRDDELINDIDCFIKAMELVSRDNGCCIHNTEEKQMIEGLEKFPKIFMSLWW